MKAPWGAGRVGLTPPRVDLAEHEEWRSVMEGSQLPTGDRLVSEPTRAAAVQSRRDRDGPAYHWRLEYDPDANGGGGAVTVWLGEEKTVLNLAAGARADGAEFDRFGLFNMQDNNGKDCVIYLDELRYTAGER
jgi:hypothetical protein